MEKCIVFNKCGGCKYLDVPYEEQLKRKTEYIRNLLNIKDVKNTIGMENPYNYRNKGKYAFKNGKMGFYEEGSHNIVYSRCNIQNDIINDVAEKIGELVKKYNISIYNEDTQKGFLRHCVIRYGAFTNEIMVIFVTVNGKMYKKDEIVKELISSFPNIKSIVQNINTKKTNAILGNEIYKLYGTNFIYDKIGSLKFKISPLSFYQVNPIQMKKLYDVAIKEGELTKNDVVFDLYSGIGTISLSIAEKVKKVYGIEIVKDAVKDAVENAKINNIKNVNFMAGKVEELLPRLCDSSKANVVFVDPPRSGLDKKTVDLFLKVKPKKIVYISCGPESLAENLKDLKKLYNVVKVQPVDMFPFTDHVETVVVLKSRKI